MNCPKCNHPCDRDEVFILTGTLHGPWVCRGCGWSDDPQRDWSNGVLSAAVTVDTSKEK